MTTDNRQAHQVLMMRRKLIDLWKTARNPEKGKPTGQRGTYIKCYNTHYADESQWTVAVKYHNTNVVTYDGQGNVLLNHGGYRTRTTKARINQYSPHGIEVYQKDFEWYVRDTRFRPQSRVFSEYGTKHLCFPYYDPHGRVVA